ncbi:DNA ligase, putative [Bodo saltans]|uniref:DNA ligase n=1 Tax=Bodo saltans TaxID=75058 RepID=A0A0S4JRM8_BODSA|nr:DNA ligase, putative [Bodo saltans]|eukprot:CUG92908.1 DNA ligase, putative [Bodo saltans]
MSVVIDSSLRFFGALCDQITSDSKLAVKEEMIAGFVARYRGDLGLLFKFLLPKYNGRLYHLQDKQLIKLFALALNRTEKTLKDDVNTTGCIATTVSKLFVPRLTATIDPSSGWCTLRLEDVEAHLEALSKVTQEDAQLAAIQKFLNVACKRAVFIYLRQIKQDLKLGANIRSILSGLHPSANDIFKQCANIQEVVRRVQAGDIVVAPNNDDEEGSASRARSPSPGGVVKGSVTATITVGMPMSPMLAAPSKGVDHVLTKCPNGAYSETKYDGERIQIHKNGDKFTFFARSLKPMKVDKFEGLEPFLVKALSSASSCILDGEILLMDITTSQPLPFGTLGKHKKAQFTTACTCIVLFDIMYLNGASLLNTPLDERRNLIKTSVNFIPNRVVLSEMRQVTGTLEQRTHILKKHLGHAIAEGLEGLVIKDIKSFYEPAARHWVKLKKDYLDGMADSADLVVLGAYYGSGNKGGLLSTFLMGVCDKSVPVGGKGRWKTVCKVGNGHDDATIVALNATYKTTMQTPVNGKAPIWADVHNSHIPDVFVINPEASDVWEIIGAEFSTTKTHTAATISFRFPRVLKRRDDKDPNTATSLDELVKLVEVSKEKATRIGLASDLPNDDEDVSVVSPVTAAAPPPPRVPLASTVVMSEDAAPSLSRYSRAHEDDDDYRARFAPIPATVVVPIDDEEQLPRAPSYHTAATVTFATPPSALVEYVCSEIAQPLSTPGMPHQNMVILHSTALKGKWSNRGTMGSITKFLGEEPQDAYNEMSPTINMGEVIFCEVSNRMSSGKLYVGTMIGQNSVSRAGEVPQVNKDAFELCIRKGVKFAVKYDASLHIAKLDRVTGVDWASVDALIKSLAKEHNTRIVVYSRDGGALARTKTYATVPPSIEAPAGFTRIATKSPSPSLESPTAVHTPSIVGSTSPPSSPPTPAASIITVPCSAHAIYRGFHSPPSSPPTPAASIITVPLTRTESDLGNSPFFDRCVCAVSPSFGLRDAATIRQKLTMTGGRAVTIDQLSEATHVIATGEYDTGVAAAVGGKRPIVSRGWVDESFVAGKRLSQDSYLIAIAVPAVPSIPTSRHSPPSPAAPQVVASSPPQRGGSMVFLTLQGCKVVLEGFTGKEREELNTKICMMGGTTQERWKTTGSDKSTHLVTFSMTSEAQRAADLGGVVLKRSWVDEALGTGVAPAGARLAAHLWGDSATTVVPHAAPQPGFSAAQSPPSAAAAIVHRAGHQAVVTTSPYVVALPPTLREDSEPTPLKPAPPPSNVRTASPPQSPSTFSPSVSRAQSPPITAAATSFFFFLLAGKSLCLEGFGVTATEQLAALLGPAGFGATVLPRSEVQRAPLIICDTLTAVSRPMCVAGSARLVVTTEWLRRYHQKGTWIEPKSELRFLCGAALGTTNRAVSPPISRRRDRSPSSTDDDDLAPPAKSSRQEKLGQAQQQECPPNPVPSLPPTQIPETLVVDDNRTETASTISDRVGSPSLPSTDVDEEAPKQAAAFVAAELPPLLDGMLAVMMPLNTVERDADVAMSLNEARRYVIAFGGEVATSMAQLHAEWDAWGARRTPSGVTLLVAAAPMAPSRDAIHNAIKILTTAGIPVMGVISKQWVLDSVQQGTRLPTSF